jgi:membrane protease YdiL (CAAX protease family)
VLRSLAVPEADVPPWSPGTALLMPLILLLAQIAGAVALLSLLAGEAQVAPLLGWILGSLIAAAYLWSALRQNRAALRLGPTKARLPLVLLFAFGMAVLIDLIDLGVTGSFLPAPELAGLVGANAGLAGALAAALLMLLAQPVADELAFRGVFFPMARQRLGGWGGLLTVALLYGLFHMIIYTSDPGVHLWHTLGTPALSGLVISGVRAHTRSTRAAIVAHVGFGIFALIKLLAVI